jgi:hypothetical protein
VSTKNNAIVLPIAALFMAGCSTMSTLPTEDNVKVSREAADEDCKFLSKVEGRSLDAKATEEDVLKDMRQEAANKGANFLLVEQYSATGTAVMGKAYKCP